jgi:predicted RNase H-like HicB family nuclease
VNRRYELIIYWSKDDDSFVVEVPELPGCMADGQTYAEAVANAEVVIEEWSDWGKRHGRLSSEGSWSSDAGAAEIQWIETARKLAQFQNLAGNSRTRKLVTRLPRRSLGRGWSLFTCLPRRLVTS